MSAETKAELERAIRAHVKDEVSDDAFVTAYLCGVEYASVEMGPDATGLKALRPEEQGWTTSVGIARALEGAFLPARPTFLIDS